MAGSLIFSCHMATVLYNHFALKYFRHALAVIHFNANLNRENKIKNGVKQIHVAYPKFKNGDAVVRNVKVQQKFGIYVIFK